MIKQLQASYVLLSNPHTLLHFKLTARVSFASSLESRGGRNGETTCVDAGAGCPGVSAVNKVQPTEKNPSELLVLHSK